MSASLHARAAYGDPVQSLRAPRDVEFDLLARVTRKLRAATSSTPIRFADLAAAMHENRKLWMALATDLADPGNSLPGELRASLFFLAEFSLQHMEKVLEGAADPDVLVDINTSVMRGLRGIGAMS
jgi:flagellar protein FlaF